MSDGTLQARAIRMLRAGDQPKEVAQTTGLTLSEVQELQRDTPGLSRPHSQAAVRPQPTSTPEHCGHITELPIRVLVAHPANVRTDLGDPEELAQLEQSIAEQGLLQPLAVMRRDRQYVLLAGHRRLAAARNAGLMRVPVIVHDNRTDASAVEAMLVENLQRAGLHPLDEARAYQQLLDTGRTMAAIARKVGKHQGHISQRVALLNLTPAEQAAMRRGDIGIVDAYKTGRQRSGRRMTTPQRRPKPRNVPHFTKAHPLAHLAALACDHDTLLKLGPACGPCWETVIRTDQAARAPSGGGV